MITGPLRHHLQAERVYALVGASAAIAAAVGPLLGGFITTFLSWRVAFLLEALLIVGVLLQQQVSTALEADAQVVGNAQLEELLAGRRGEHPGVSPRPPGRRPAPDTGAPAVVPRAVVRYCPEEQQPRHGCVA